MIFTCVCLVEVVVHSHQPKHFGDLLLHLRGVAAEKSSSILGSCRSFTIAEHVTSASRGSNIQAT